MNFVLIAFFLICLFTLALAGYSFAPWVPTRKKDLPRIFKLAKLSPGQIFYDLGCGDGKVVIYANKNFGAKAIGLELALPFYLLCKVRQILNNNVNLTFKFKNLFKEDLSKADVIYFFAESADKLKGKIKQKLEQQAKPGARIISYVFPVEGWQPTVIDKPSEKDVAIYLYNF